MKIPPNAKIALIDAIADNMHKREITQRELADELETTESRVSHMMNGRHRLFSFECLMGYCMMLGMEVIVEVID